MKRPARRPNRVRQIRRTQSRKRRKASPGRRQSPGADTKPGADSKQGDTKANAANTAADRLLKRSLFRFRWVAQTGEKNVRAKVKLDLKQFKLKQGQQLQYLVRVYDSRRSSVGRPVVRRTV